MKPIFLKRTSPSLDLSKVWNDPRYSDQRQALDARLKIREKAMQRARDVGKGVALGIVFWSAMFAAAEFGLGSVEHGAGSVEISNLPPDGREQKQNEDENLVCINLTPREVRGSFPMAGLNFGR